MSEFLGLDGEILGAVGTSPMFSVFKYAAMQCCYSTLLLDSSWSSTFKKRNEEMTKRILIAALLVLYC